MSTMVAPCLPQTSPGGASGFNLLPHRICIARSRRRRCLVEGAAAMLAGALIATGCGAIDAAEGRASPRREAIERDLAELRPLLDEFTRLERTREAARVSAEQTTARARPYFELRSLLEALSSEARSGVAVSRLQRMGEAIELRVHAADSATCAAWVERLARVSGAESAEITDLKLIAAPIGSHGAPSVEAVVRVQWSGAATVSPLRRAGLDDRARAARSAR
jgi:type II secretory pathway component PulM